MRDMRFFEGVPHREIVWGDYEVFTPAFYYDFAQLTVALAAPLDRIEALLPARWLYPLRPAPRSGVAVIAAYQYRDCDLGPYNEVLIGFPVAVGRRLPVLAGLRRFAFHGGAISIWQLPVTTPIARDLGIEIAGYPKFLADIAFTSEARATACRLDEGGRHILTIRVKHGPCRGDPARMRVEPITVKGDRVLRSAATMSIPTVARSWRGRGVELTLGDHPLADAIRRLDLGRVLMAAYSSNAQSILSSPVESWPLGGE